MYMYMPNRKGFSEFHEGYKQPSQKYNYEGLRVPVQQPPSNTKAWILWATFNHNDSDFTRQWLQDL